MLETSAVQTPKAHEGAWLWLYKIVAGVLIAFGHFGEKD